MATQPKALAAALAYAKRGWLVFPSNGKDDHLTKWVHGDGSHLGEQPATTDPKIIRQWWTKWPKAQVCIATGPSNLVVIDLDVDKAKELDGIAEWEKLTNDDGTDLVARTPRNGLQLFFSAADGTYRTGTNVIAAGIDVRATGGMVVAPPSNGRTWERSGEVEAVPAWLDQLLRKRSTEGDGAATTAEGRSQIDVAEYLGGLGQGERDDGAYRYACSMRARRFDRIEAEGAMALLVAAMTQPEGDEFTLEQGIEKIDRVWAEFAAGHQTEQAKPGERASLKWTRGDQIEMKPQHFLWSQVESVRSGRIPMGELTALAGDPGLGKSTAAFDIAASITQGTLPGVYFGQPKGVVIATTEDDYSTIVKPRMVAAGADMARVVVIEAESIAQGMFTVNVDDLADACNAVDAALVIVDPLTAALDGQIDDHRDTAVRTALKPLRQFTKQRNIALLGVMHTVKSQAANALASIQGSRGYGAVVRSALFVVDPEDGTPKLFCHIKTNYGDLAPTLEYTIGAREVQAGDDFTAITGTKIEWGDEVATTANQALAKRSDQKPPRDHKRQDARAWLDEHLPTQGSVDPETLFAEYPGGCDKKTFRRAYLDMHGGSSTQADAKGARRWHRP